MSKSFEEIHILTLLIQFYNALFSEERRHNGGRSCGGLESPRVLTPGPDGNCVTVWVRPVVGGSSSGAGKQLTLGTWEDCSPAAVGRRRRQGVMRGSAQDLSGGDTP